MKEDSKGFYREVTDNGQVFIARPIEFVEGTVQYDNSRLAAERQKSRERVHAINNKINYPGEKPVYIHKNSRRGKVFVLRHRG